MFRTIGHTFELMKMSWRVLMKDRELIFFPIFGVIGAGIAVGIFAAIAAAAGSLDRIQDVLSDSETKESLATGDIVLLVLLYVAVYFVTIFFNAALIAAALERLRGGDPNIRSGLAVASRHIPAILGWAVIAATVGLILQMMRDRQNNIIGQLFVGLLQGAWSLMTFFVIPVLVAEGLGPIAAIKRSSSMIRGTWGRQITASFGFGIMRMIAGVVAILPAALVFAVSPVLGIMVGVITISIAFGIVGAMEGIFKAALYEYSNGEKPVEFDTEVLRSAYQPDLRVQRGTR